MKLGIIATQIAKDDASSAFYFDDFASSAETAARQPANDGKDAGRVSGIFPRPAPRPAATAPRAARAAKTARRRP